MKCRRTGETINIEGSFRLFNEDGEPMFEFCYDRGQLEVRTIDGMMSIEPSSGNQVRVTKR